MNEEHAAEVSAIEAMVNAYAPKPAPTDLAGAGAAATQRLPSWTVFSGKPPDPPYVVGDLYENRDTSDVFRAVAARSLALWLCHAGAP